MRSVEVCAKEGKGREGLIYTSDIRVGTAATVEVWCEWAIGSFVFGQVCIDGFGLPGWSFPCVGETTTRDRDGSLGDVMGAANGGNIGLHIHENVSTIYRRNKQWRQLAARTQEAGKLGVNMVVFFPSFETQPYPGPSSPDAKRIETPRAPRRAYRLQTVRR